MANILYTNFHREDGGGHTTYVLSLLKNSLHNKFVACPCTSALYTQLREQGYDKLVAVDFPGKLKQYREIVKNTLLLKKAVEDNNIDIVHTNGSSDNRMAFYASLITRKKFKVVYTKHNTYGLKGKISRLRLRLFNDATIFVEDLIEYFKLDKNYPRYHVVKNGIDLEHWKRREPIGTGKRLTLISNAGAGRHKGWHHLVEAVAGLDEEEKQRISVVLLSRHEPEMEKEMAEAEQVCNFSRPGFFQDVRPYLERADIGFVVSYKEACSFACREMLAMGLPLVISDFPTLVHSINDDCGWVTKVKDVESIRRTLREILALPSERLDAMKKAARAKAEADFDLWRMIERTNSVYAALEEKSPYRVAASAPA